MGAVAAGSCHVEAVRHGSGQPNRPCVDHRPGLAGRGLASCIPGAITPLLVTVLAPLGKEVVHGQGMPGTRWCLGTVVTSGWSDSKSAPASWVLLLSFSLFALLGLQVINLGCVGFLKTKLKLQQTKAISHASPRHALCPPPLPSVLFLAGRRDPSTGLLRPCLGRDDDPSC